MTRLINDRQLWITTLLLALFAMLTSTLVAFTYANTKQRIIKNQEQALLDNLNVLIPADLYDNPLLEEKIQVTDPDFLGTNKAISVYRATKQGKPIALALNVIAPDGYGGAIKLLVAIWANGELAGVRVLQHNETPGLGDGIEAQRSDWIYQFKGQSLDNTTQAQWRVKKDGGQFDQLTGATITPRAVVKAVYLSLLYYQQHRETLWQ